jgi:uncharacterized OsmC-like protein
MTKLAEIKRALERADKVVTDNPGRGQRTYQNRAVIVHGTLCEIEEKGFRFSTDVGRGLGGSDDSPTPGTFLRTALSGCIAIGIKLWAARKDVPVENIEVTLEADSDARGILGLSDMVAPGFTGLRVSIAVCSPALPEAVEEVIAASLRYSPIWDVVRNAQPIAADIRINGGVEPVTVGGDDGR